MVARDLVARSHPQGRGVRRKFCKGFSPGEVDIPGSLQKNSRGPPLGYTGVSGGGGGVACCRVISTPLPKAAQVGRNFLEGPAPLVVDAGCGGGSE